MQKRAAESGPLFLFEHQLAVNASSQKEALLIPTIFFSSFQSCRRKETNYLLKNLLQFFTFFYIYLTLAKRNFFTLTAVANG
jgi:hypothetical protein